ncbi:glutaminase A [Coraliomargarita parva]|uniref:glutaminase A n=1 Tax=Coraliomargarita parva TaxID=3014050 RepID=UPI0022B4F188|nr:glutaminase A [Coraliomargarita parva]
MIQATDGYKEASKPLADSPIQKILESLHSELAKNHEGEVATYIPELGKADSNWFGVCLVTADGQVYEVGDVDQQFTIQSISKPFVYGMALEDNGKSEVLRKIWMEPSGEAFNAISLRPGTGQPANPMINAGAIATTSLVEGKSAKQKINRILDSLGRYCGRQLSVDQSVYRSESSTGHRNRAIGYMLRNFEIIGEDPTASLEAYFMQCSVSVNCRDLAIMSATLANGGINPVTGLRAVVSDYVESILSIMGSCGMYDAAGEWIYNVGMPAKSGVAGGIAAVLPGQLGIGVFSPRLDVHGNSVRGIEVCREISRKFDLHMFHAPRMSTSALRKRTDLSKMRSHRLRSGAESKLLDEHGSKVRVVTLQGDLVFASAEVAVREFSYAGNGVQELIIDFGHVSAVDFSSCGVIAMAVASWMDEGGRLSLSRCLHLPFLTKILRKYIPKRWDRIRIFEDIDQALESSENWLLETVGVRRHSQIKVDLAECELLAGIAPDLVAAFESNLKRVRFVMGATVLKAGDDAVGGMYFLLRGKASAWIGTGAGRERRVAIFAPGMSFGEMALMDRSTRSAEIRADTDIEALELTQEAYEKLEASGSVLYAGLLRNLACILSRRLRDANFELSSE